MTRLHVGLNALPGDIKKYQADLDLVELHPVDASLPVTVGLRRWRKATAPTFVFSVVLPRVVGELGAGKAVDDGLAKSLEVATVLEARCIVLQTPSDIRPTSANRKKIAALFTRIPPEGTLRFWEPHGMWEREDVIDTARSAGVLPVFDAAREEPASGQVLYTRLRALGAQTTPSASTIERVAKRLQGRREVFVVLEGSRGAALRVKSSLVAALARQSAARDSGIVPPVTTHLPRPLVAEDEEQ
jgi:uncharacterized protein YecE (DUF72 family)